MRRVVWRCETCLNDFVHDEDAKGIPDCSGCGSDQVFRVCTLCNTGLVGDEGPDPRNIDSLCTNDECWGHITMYDRLHLLTTAKVIRSNSRC